MNKARILAGAIFAVFIGSFVLIQPTAADEMSIWLGGSDNWNDSANWSNVPTLFIFPNNGNDGLAYDVLVDNGTVSLDQNIVIQEFNLDGGTLNGSLNLTVSNLITWTIGTMGGSGRTLADGLLTINGIVTLDTRTLVVAGSATVTNGGLNGANGGVLSNLSGSTFNLTDDSSVGNPPGSAGPFLNVGTLLKSGAGNNSSGNGVGTSVIGWPLTNSGTIQVNMGTLSINRGGLSSGIITVAPPGRVVFPGDYTLLNGTLSGAGVVQFTGGTVTVTGTVTAVTGSQVLLSGGSLNGSGALMSSGQLVWTGGGMGGNGRTVTDGPLTINGNVTLDTRTLIVAGSATVTNGGLSGQSGAVLSNLTGSTFNIADDSGVGNSSGTAGPFLNAGTLVKSGAGNNVGGEGMGTSVIGWPLTNSGTIQVNSGTLNFSRGYIQTAGATVLDGGTLVASSPMTIQGGSLIGTGTVIATVLNNGVLSPGFGAGSLSINGPLTQQSSANLLMEIGGYVRGTQYDFISVGGTATFGGNLTVTFINNFTRSITNGATFTLLAAGAPIKGAFGNVANGSMLTTSDGFGRFTVNYGGSNLVLTGLQIVDSIGDGIPDWWRAQYFGGNGSTTNHQSCALCDADGTGQDNLFKYVAGLDPTNPISVFVVQAVSIADQPKQENIIYQPVVSGRTYTVQFATNLIGGVYTNLTGFSGPTSNLSQVTVDDLTATQTQKFYRIDISLP